MKGFVTYWNLTHSDWSNEGVCDLLELNSLGLVK
jgi:hypothetical protein